MAETKYKIYAPASDTKAGLVGNIAIMNSATAYGVGTPNNYVVSSLPSGITRLESRGFIAIHPSEPPADPSLDNTIRYIYCTNYDVDPAQWRNMSNYFTYLTPNSNETIWYNVDSYSDFRIITTKTPSTQNPGVATDTIPNNTAKSYTLDPTHLYFINVKRSDVDSDYAYAIVNQGVLSVYKTLTVSSTSYHWTITIEDNVLTIDNYVQYGRTNIVYLTDIGAME